MLYVKIKRIEMKNYRQILDHIFNRKFNYIHLIVTFILSFVITIVILDILELTNLIDIL